MLLKYISYCLDILCKLVSKTRGEEHYRISHENNLLWLKYIHNVCIIRLSEVCPRPLFCIFLFCLGFGSTGHAFSYSYLQTRKYEDADACNPNMYSSLDDIKDNKELENVYDEIRKRVSNNSLVKPGKILNWLNRDYFFLFSWILCWLIIFSFSCGLWD